MLADEWESQEMIDVEVSGASRATLMRPEGEAKALANQAGHPADLRSSPARAGDRTADFDADQEGERIVVVQCEVVWCSHWEHLHALRNIQHRMLNAAMRAWWETDGKDRSVATAAVKDVVANERSYWAEQIPKIETGIEKLRARRVRTDEERAKRDEEMTANQRKLKRAELSAGLQPPSAIYDACVYFTSSKWREYKKLAFRGEASMATFRHGQPVRVRDGSWKVERSDRGGVYDMTMPVASDGRKVEHATLRLVPDGGSSHRWMKLLTDGDARPCDARIVYAERKGKWFAKLTIATAKTRLVPTGEVAAVRRGMHSALVIIAQNGDVHTIDGGGLLEQKQRIEARRRQIGFHLRKMELGSGARGRGVKRRFRALAKIEDAEKRIVDSTMKQWAAKIARWCRESGRNVSRVIVADGSVSEFHDKIDGETVAPFIRKWPFAAFADRLEETLRNAGITVERKATQLDARRCPVCRHVNAQRPAGRTFTCDACDEERPADQIVAWNMLIAEVGGGPIKRRIRKRNKMVKEMRET